MSRSAPRSIPAGPSAAASKAAFRAAVAGFSLIEMLVALVLTGLALSALSLVTGQWLPFWQRGLSLVSQTDVLALAMDRMADDLAAALFVPAHDKSRKPLFEGTTGTVVFVRTALGPNAQPGLEIVRLEAAEGGLTRSVTAYAPRSEAAGLPPFGPPVAVLDGRYRVSFSYAGSDGRWLDGWRNAITLPRAIRMVLRDGRSGQVLQLSSAVVVRAELPARCVTRDRGPPCVPVSAIEPAQASRARQGDGG